MANRLITSNNTNESTPNVGRFFFPFFSLTDGSIRDSEYTVSKRGIIIK